MPLSTELKWLSIFKLMFGQANYWFQNFIKSNTYHSKETHWVRLLNYTSPDRWRSCWATDKVREWPRTAGDEMANLRRQGFSRLLSSYSKGSETATLLSPSSSPTVRAAFCTPYYRQYLALARMKMSCPHSKHQHAPHFNTTD